MLLTGVGPAPSLLAASSGDDGDGDSTTSTTAATVIRTDDTTAATAPSGSPDRSGGVVDAAGAGTVAYERSGAALRLVDAIPSPGWRVEIEEDDGREVEVDFRRGTQRVQVNLELEDGAVRERVRIRDLADGSDVRIENGTIVRAATPDNDLHDRGDDRGDDRSGDDDWDDRRGRGGDDRDDHSGDDRGDDHSGDDDRDDRSGRGGDDRGDDD